MPNEETKRNMKDNHADYSGKNHPRYGTHCSEETKNKIREFNKKYKGENHPFKNEVAKQIEENQKSGWLSEVQYASSASGNSIVFSTLILAYTEE